MNNIIEGRFLLYNIDTLKDLIANELYLSGIIFKSPTKVALNCLENQTVYFYKSQIGEDDKYKLIRDGFWSYAEDGGEEQ